MSVLLRDFILSIVYDPRFAISKVHPLQHQELIFMGVIFAMKICFTDAHCRLGSHKELAIIMQYGKCYKKPVRSDCAVFREI